MKRNGLVFDSSEPPKRAILYPKQDFASQQQPNGLQARTRTALAMNRQNQNIQEVVNPTRILRQYPVLNQSNHLDRLSGKSSKIHCLLLATNVCFFVAFYLDHNENALTVVGYILITFMLQPFHTVISRQRTATSSVQKHSNPYYSNPFLRPKTVVQQQNKATPSSSGSGFHRDSPIVTTTTVPLETSATTNITTIRGRTLIHPKTHSPSLQFNGRQIDSETSSLVSSNQDDARRWAHYVGPASIARRFLNHERPNRIMYPFANQASDT
jgi:hypothetical protein